MVYVAKDLIRTPLEPMTDADLDSDINYIFIRPHGLQTLPCAVGDDRGISLLFSTTALLYLTATVPETWAVIQKYPLTAEDRDFSQMDLG